MIIDGGGRTLLLGASGSIVVGNGVTLTLRNINLMGRASNTGPLVEVNGGTLELEPSVIISDNTNITTAGGGVSVLTNGTLKLKTGAVIRNNTSLSNGGGVYVDTGKLEMTGGTITDNAAENGGGIWAGNTNQLAISNAVIRDNTASSTTGGGGGMYVTNTTGTLEDSFVTGNTVSASATNYNANGGGIYVTNNSTFTMTRGNISNNAAVRGGGVVVLKSAFIMQDGEITSNTVTNTNPFGAGVYLRDLDNIGNIFTIQGCPRVNQNNKVYVGSLSRISIPANLTGAGIVAYIETSVSVEDQFKTTAMLTGAAVFNNYNRLSYTGALNFNGEGKLH